MTLQTVEPSVVYPTEHPYIVRVPGVCDGRPIIKGTRISVRHIAQLYKAGDLVDEMLQAHPHLKAAAVYDAISYYLDHQGEIEQEIAEHRAATLPKERPKSELEQVLLQDGLLTHVKPPISDLRPYQNRRLIETQGRPLSEVIIEERR
jgi:uncharacterized protein (DUF433 family)